ncbi:hypothetical protein [Vibrio parahaemolyticus]|uniref:defense against restriction DarA-related protein n=1 Tax=Vibrio parahaemolyticus TaxID=670 RepID=UPI00064B334F|nr:hypothetical protein [Vibrio parahaemolyticus]EII3125321.1 hypothetical protein [Vibrio parahaemolyticus]
MNPAKGLKVFAMPDPLAKGFTRSQVSEAMYQLTADPEQAALMMEVEPLSVMDAAYIEGELVEKQDGFVLDAVTTSYAVFPRTMKALARALNRALSSSDVTVTGHEVGQPKKNNLFATVAAQFTLSDGQAISVVFHAPDEDPKIFKPDDIVIAFRWLLNKRDITPVVAPEMSKGKMREVSLTTIGKRIGHLAAENSKAFQAKQKEVTAAREQLASLEESANSLLDELNKLTTEVSQLEGRDQELEHMVTVKSEELATRKSYNDSLREKIAALKAAAPEPTPEPTTEQGEGEPQPEENAALERFQLVDPSLYNDVLSSMSTITAIDRGEEKGLTRSLFVNSIVNKLKTRHNNGQSEVVDAALDFISEAQKTLDKPIISARNGVWALHSNATGSKEEKDEQATPEPDAPEASPTSADTPSPVEPDTPAESQEGESSEMNEQSIGDKPQAVLTLENIVNGVHDDVAADDVLEMIEEASEELEKLELVEQYDALIGSAVERYAELDEKQE